MTISPKSQYLSLRKTEAEEFTKLVAEPAIKAALVYAFAEFAMECPSAEKLSGASRFIQTFINISDPQNQQVFPSKELKTLV